MLVQAPAAELPIRWTIELGPRRIDFRNDGSGTFALAASAPVGAGALAVTVGQFFGAAQDGGSGGLDVNDAGSVVTDVTGMTLGMRLLPEVAAAAAAAVARDPSVTSGTDD
jgi:hypothetical protein